MTPRALTIKTAIGYGMGESFYSRHTRLHRRYSEVKPKLYGLPLETKNTWQDETLNFDLIETLRITSLYSVELRAPQGAWFSKI